MMQLDDLDLEAFGSRSRAAVETGAPTARSRRRSCSARARAGGACARRRCAARGLLGRVENPVVPTTEPRTPRSAATRTCASVAAGVVKSRTSVTRRAAIGVRSSFAATRTPSGPPPASSPASRPTVAWPGASTAPAMRKEACVLCVPARRGDQAAHAPGRATDDEGRRGLRQARTRAAPARGAARVGNSSGACVSGSRNSSSAAAHHGQRSLHRDGVHLDDDGASKSGRRR